MLFGTSGIRGLYGKEVDERLALRIAALFSGGAGTGGRESGKGAKGGGSGSGAKGGDAVNVVVARDTRTTGESLSFAAISGILGTGRNAVYLGVVPTPTLALATAERKCKGIMITASHNPPGYNGIKLYDNGREIGRAAEAEIEKKYNDERGNGKTEISFCDWNKCGKRIDDSDGTALREHSDLIKKIINLRAVAGRKPKVRVVVDCNGAGAVLTPKLLGELGCEVISINDGLSGFSVARASEPNAENLKGLAAKVRAVGADLGIGHDGDADRAVVVDEKGDVLPLDVQLAMMIEHELGKAGRKGAKVVSTVEASLCIRDVVGGAGAELIITPVGSNYVSDAIIREGAVFGGEPCGEYVFSGGLAVPDGILTAAKFVEIFCEKGKLSEIKNKYRTYPIIREKYKTENKYSAIEKIKKEIKNKTTPGDKIRIRDDDGIRVDGKDGWFLVRASGTEPYIRLTAEYKNPEILNKKAGELRELIRKGMGKGVA